MVRSGTAHDSPLRCLAQEIRDVSGRFLCYQASTLTSPERKRAQEALREAHQLQ